MLKKLAGEAHVAAQVRNGGTVVSADGRGVRQSSRSGTFESSAEGRGGKIEIAATDRFQSFRDQPAPGSCSGEELPHSDKPSFIGVRRQCETWSHQTKCRN
jgi:hypothetical protein